METTTYVWVSLGNVMKAKRSKAKHWQSPPTQGVMYSKYKRTTQLDDSDSEPGLTRTRCVSFEVKNARNFRTRRDAAPSPTYKGHGDGQLGTMPLHTIGCLLSPLLY
jgi:hypothetical protein